MLAFLKSFKTWAHAVKNEVYICTDFKCVFYNQWFYFHCGHQKLFAATDNRPSFFKYLALKTFVKDHSL